MPKADSDVTTAIAEFESLVAALERFFEREFDDLPPELQRLVNIRFFHVPWESLSPTRRREVALQSDYSRDPAYAVEQEDEFALISRTIECQAKRKAMVNSPTPDATALGAQETSLADIDCELAAIEETMNRIRGQWRQRDKHEAGLYGPIPKKAISSMPGSPAQTPRKPRLRYATLLQWWINEYIPLHPEPDKRPPRKKQRDDAARRFPDYAPPSEGTMAKLRGERGAPEEWREPGRRPGQEAD